MSPGKIREWRFDFWIGGNRFAMASIRPEIPDGGCSRCHAVGARERKGDDRWRGQEGEHEILG